MQRVQLKRRITDLLHLPICRNVLAKALDLVGGPDEDAERLSGVVFADPGLAAELCRAVYAPAVPEVCGTLTPVEIVSRLGLAQVRRLVVARALAYLLEEHGAGHEAWEDAVRAHWRHAFTTAVCCRVLAERSSPSTNPESLLPAGSALGGRAYLAGLLHDLGKLVLAAVSRSINAPDVGRADGDIPAIVDVEEEWGLDHTLAGKWLAEEWRFPEGLVEAIWLHHHGRAGAARAAHDDAPALKTLELARALAPGVDQDDGAPPLALSQRQLDEFGVTEREAADLVSACRAAVRAGLAAFADEGELDAAALRAALGVLSADACAAPEHATAARRAERFRAVHEMYQATLACRSLKETHELIVGHIRRTLRIAPCICCVVDLHGAELLLQTWKTLTERPRRFTVALESSPGKPEQSALLSALHALGLGVAEEGWAGSELRDVMNWGGLVAAPMLVRGKCYGQIVFDAAAAGFVLTEDQFAELLAFAAACGLAVSQQETREHATRQIEDQVGSMRREEQLRKRLEHAERLAVMGEYSARTAQSLNTPLSMASAQLQWLIGQTADGKIRKTLGGILRHTRSAYRTVKDLLLVAKPPQPKLEPTLVNYILHQAAAGLQDGLQHQGIRLVENYAEGLPRIHADRRLLEHVFVNLLMRSQDNLAGKGGVITVQTWAAPDRRSLLVRIADTGAASTPAAGEQAFEPWAASGEGGASPGLSLLVCREIVQAHRGRIEIESVPGGGNAVTIELPAAAVAARPPAMRPSEQEPETGKTCLVADSDPGVRSVLTRTLSSRNFHVTAVKDGAEALEAIEGRRFTVIILDMKMPRLDGYRFLSILRARGDEAPVIAVTGSPNPADAERAVRAGARVCLQKPFQLKRLLDEVDEALKTELSRAQ